MNRRTFISGAALAAFTGTLSIKVNKENVLSGPIKDSGKHILEITNLRPGSIVAVISETSIPISVQKISENTARCLYDDELVGVEVTIVVVNPSFEYLRIPGVLSASDNIITVNQKIDRYYGV